MTKLMVQRTSVSLHPYPRHNALENTANLWRRFLRFSSRNQLLSLESILMP